MSASRVIIAAMTLMLKLLFRARVVIMAVVFQPVVYAVVAGLLFTGHGTRRASLSWAIGAATMGLWSAVLFFGGGMLTRERRQRTLEAVVAAPAPLTLVVIGACLATATLALYSLASTFFVAIVFFKVPLQIARPGYFGLAMLAAVGCVGMSGVALASLFVLFRQAGIFQNALEYPVWIASGLLAPAGLLWGPFRAIGRILPTTWAYLSMRDAVDGGPVGSALGYCLACGTACLLIGGVLLGVAEHRARVMATLPLS